MKYPITNYTETIRKLFLLNSENDFTMLVKGIGDNGRLITNPIISALVSTYYSIPKQYEDFLADYESIDMAYCRVTGHILDKISPELARNNNFLSELKRRMLGRTRGPFFAAFNEIFVASYLKSIGYSISFNSSKEKGKPDLEVVGPTTFAVDVKTFPDHYFWFESQVVQLLPSLQSRLEKTSGMQIMVFVEKKSPYFRKELLENLDQFLLSGKPQESESCSVLLLDIAYVGEQGILIKQSGVKSSLRIIPSIPFLEDDILSKVSKAVNQQNSFINNGMVWILFPNDKEFSIGRRIVWEASTVPLKTKNLGSSLALYDFFISQDGQTKQWNYRYGIDILEDTDKYPGISRKSFKQFVEDLLNIPTIYFS